MSVFDGNLTERSFHTAREIADIEVYSSPSELGRIHTSYQWRTPEWKLSEIDHKSLDAIIDNILSYIYYYVKLGMCNLCSKDINHNHYSIRISTYIFGVTQKNYILEESSNIIHYVCQQLEKLGFRTSFSVNDIMLLISWDDAVEKLLQEQINTK